MDIGIDLGTTFSVIAVNGKVELTPEYPPGIYLEECDVTIIPTPYGEPTFPSVVIDDPDQPGHQLCAADALQKAEEGHAPVMFSKRKIGTREAIAMPTRIVLAKEVARDFLRFLKRCAEKALGQPIARAIVTHPAYFDRNQVEETREAASEAGFDMSLPEQMLMEPVAAALAYTRSDGRDPLRILTYDLGGGTFDVTYLERSSGVIDMRAFDGDHLLGGYNFDRELVHWLRKRIAARGRRISLDEDDPVDRGRLAQLLRLAENVKIALSQAATDTTMVDFRVRGILVDTDGKDVQVNERLSRAEFVQMIKPSLDRTLECCRQALQKAKVKPEEVDEILLVGGSTYGPWVKTAMMSAFPSAEPKLFQPDLCVGAGAAIHAKMILPPLIREGKYKLLLDVPEKAVLETINVAGYVADADGQRAGEGLTITLHLPDGRSRQPLRTSGAGRFFFEDVELTVDAPNQFRLTVSDQQGCTVLDHPFQVLYAPETAETSCVTTVLPKPLAIETSDGLVPLAAEGVTLPALCEQTFQRQNDNPNISLRLFQERDPIGEIRIENIPPEGGRGSFVDLKVEVTEKNQIRGTACVRTRDGKVVAQTDVRVHFEIPEVPVPEELWEQFVGLQRRCLELLVTEEERREELQTQGLALIEEVKHLFEQQPLERAEVDMALRRLNALLNPPPDDIDPPRCVFCEIVERCRQSLAGLQAKASESSGELPSGSTGQGRQSLARVQRYQQVVDQLEVEGFAAYNRRDRISWARIFDALTDLDVLVQDRPRREAPPTILGKFFAQFEVMRLIGSLEEQAARLAAEDRLEDWLDEIERIQRGLDGVLREIHEVDDGLPSDQGRAQLQRVMSRILQPIKEAIERLGVDISKVSRP